MKFSKNALSINASPTLTLNEKSKILKSQGKPILNLGVGEPKNLTPIKAIEYSKACLETRQIKYTPSGGIPELKDSIIKYTSENYGRTPTQNNILVTSGAKQAIFNALLGIINPGDEVILLVPYWVSYPEMVKMVCGNPIIVIPEPGLFDHDINAVRKAASQNTKAIILNSPNNPSGVVYSPEFIKEIVVFCEQNKIYLILDDIYHKLVYGDTPWVSGYGFSDEDIDSSYIIIINGISKSYGMTGFRIGWAVTSKSLVEVMTNIQSQTTSGTSIVLQEAALGALSGPQNVVSDLVETIKNNRDITMEGLLAFRHLRINKPDGAFYCLPDFSSYNRDSMKLSKLLLEKAFVAVVPGIAFGIEGHLRVSYSGNSEEIVEALSRIRQLLDS